MPSYIPKHENLNSSQLRVLFLILKAAELGETLTKREIAKALGWKSPTHYVGQCVTHLANLGLVKCQGRLGRTIRPTCFMRLFKEATP